MKFKSCIQVPSKIVNTISTAGTKTKNNSSSLVFRSLRIFPRSSKHSVIEIGHEIIFIVIHSLLLVKVGHLLVNVALRECSVGTDQLLKC